MSFNIVNLHNIYIWYVFLQHFFTYGMCVLQCIYNVFLHIYGMCFYNESFFELGQLWSWPTQNTYYNIHVFLQI